MDDTEPEELGVSAALERICSLESRLRQAIQSTHSLNKTLGKDMGAVDKEREALLLIREHLELLEDKLRDFKAIASENSTYEDDKAITLSQLDSLRKDLLRAARDRVDFVLYSKDVVREILAFADVASGDEALPPERGSGMGPDTPTNITITPRSPPLSPIHSFDGNGSYQSFGDFRLDGSLPASSTGVSPYAARKSLQVILDDSQENFLHPAPSSTPSIRAAQTVRSYNSRATHELGQSSWASMREPPQEFKLRQRDPRQSQHEPVGQLRASLAASEHTGPPSSHGAYEPRMSRQVHRTALEPARIHDNELYSSTNGSSKYHFDPQYGGKISLMGFKDRDGDACEILPSPHKPPTAMPDRPRIVHDPSYADEQSRLASDAALQSEDSAASAQTYSSPIRSVMRKRAELAKQAAVKEPRGSGFGLRILRFLGGCGKAAAAGIVAAAVAAAVVSVVKTAQAEHARRPAKQKRPQPAHQPAEAVDQRVLPASVMHPRPDGHLVPEWMHSPESHFIATEWPPTGSLTSTEWPPHGALFPLIPPPDIDSARG